MTQTENTSVTYIGQPHAASGLALVRLIVGSMFVSVFFENLGKGANTPAG